MIRRPPRSTLDRSSAASDVYKRQKTTNVDIAADDVPALLAFAQREKIGLTIVGPEAPVSYTHLRAHETVLDLVCRLLLEKKDFHNHNDIISL